MGADLCAVCEAGFVCRQRGVAGAVVEKGEGERSLPGWRCVRVRDLRSVGDLETGSSAGGPDLFDCVQVEALQPGCRARSDQPRVRGVRQSLRGQEGCPVLLVCVPAAGVPGQDGRQPHPVMLSGAVEVNR